MSGDRLSGNRADIIIIDDPRSDESSLLLGRLRLQDLIARAEEEGVVIIMARVDQDPHAEMARRIERDCRKPMCDEGEIRPDRAPSRSYKGASGLREAARRRRQMESRRNNACGESL